MNNLTPWWQNGAIYQIYPKSFQDSTGNGHGDLAGITQRLDYLKQLGIDALWITPFYRSPQVDNGYDISDYYDIDPIYGTLSDFDNLIAEAHKRQIRIILDMVFNHTSTEHAWFKEAQHPGSSKRTFYIWRDGTSEATPNNWVSKFSGSAWQWHAESGQYYLHLFAIEQADLNWEHPPVRQELKKVCEFWADRGVDGFRLDVINLVSKQQDFPDDDRGDGRRFYTDGPRIHEFLQELNRDVFTPRQVMTVGEMSSTTLPHCQQYGNLDGSELSMTFNFHHLKVDYLNGEKWTLAKPDFVELKRLFREWQQGMHNKAWNALFWCNHDQPRIVSRFGDEGKLRVTSAKMLAMVLHGMQGTPYIYQGEELGMTNPGFTSLSQYRDVESLNMFSALHQDGKEPQELLEILRSKSRDNARTPMQWNDGAHAGFTSGTPWIDVAPNFREINAENALKDKDSVFYCYQFLIGLRKTLPVLTHGNYLDLLPQHPEIWCYQRQWNNQTLYVLANLCDRPRQWICENNGIAKNVWRKIYSNYPDTPDTPQDYLLRPFEAVYWLAEN